MKVLIVEDDNASAKVLTKTVETNGCTVTRARNGAEGIFYLLTEGPFNVVLLDLMMPNVTGEDFIKIVEDLGNRNLIEKESNIIVVSAVNDFPHLKKITENFCVFAALSKPVDIPHLLDLMKKCCTNLRVSDE